jgi:hypothetical protein
VDVVPDSLDILVDRDDFVRACELLVVYEPGKQEERIGGDEQYREVSLAKSPLPG